MSAIGFRIWEHHLDSVTGRDRPHSHFDLEVNFLTRGSLCYLHGGGLHQIGAGQWGLFWAGIPHRIIRFEKGTGGIWMTFPLQWMLDSVTTPLLELLLRGRILLTDSADFTPDQHLFSIWLRDVQDGRPWAVDQIRTELDARLRRMGRMVVRSRGKPLPVQEPGRKFSVSRTAEYLSLNYQEPINAETVARALGVHPKYLIQQFRKVTGISINEYLTGLRIAHAQRLLMTTSGSVLDIALDSGFLSLSAFYRCFAKATGVTPGAFRRGMLSS